MAREKLSADKLQKRKTTIKIYQTLLDNPKCGFSELYKSIDKKIAPSTLYVHLEVLKDYITHDKDLNVFYLNPLNKDEIVSLIKAKNIGRAIPKMNWKDKVGVANFNPDTLEYVDLINEYSELAEKLKINAKRMRRIWVGHTLFQYKKCLNDILKEDKEDRLMVLGYFYHSSKDWAQMHNVNNLKYSKNFEKYVLSLGKKAEIISEDSNWDDLEKRLNQNNLKDIIGTISHSEGLINSHIAYQMGVEIGVIKEKSLVTIVLLEKRDIMNQLIKQYNYVDNPDDSPLPLAAPFIAVDCSNY